MGVGAEFCTGAASVAACALGSGAIVAGALAAIAAWSCACRRRCGGRSGAHRAIGLGLRRRCIVIVGLAARHGLRRGVGRCGCRCRRRRRSRLAGASVEPNVVAIAADVVDFACAATCVLKPVVGFSGAGVPGTDPEAAVNVASTVAVSSGGGVCEAAAGVAGAAGVGVGVVVLAVTGAAGVVVSPFGAAAGVASVAWVCAACAAMTRRGRAAHGDAGRGDRKRRRRIGRGGRSWVGNDRRRRNDDGGGRGGDHGGGGRAAILCGRLRCSRSIAHPWSPVWSDEAALSVDLLSPVLDFVPDFGAPSAGPAALVSPGCALAGGSLSLFAGCVSLDAAASRGGGLLAGGGLSLAAERGGAEGAGGGAAGKLLSTSAPKGSLACAEGSDSAGLGGATCRDALAATSDVTLNTRAGLSR